MDNENNYRKSDSVFSRKVRAGKRRTYFFDVRQTKGNDYYLTLTESTRRFNGDGYDRHKIFLYKEDFNRFMTNLEEAVNYIKTDLMPDYDYDEFTRRHEEWEENQSKLENGEVLESTEVNSEEISNTQGNPSDEEDMSW